MQNAENPEEQGVVVVIQNQPVQIERIVMAESSVLIQNRDDIFTGDRFEYESWRFRLEAVLDEKDLLETLQDNAKQTSWKTAKAANAELSDAQKATDKVNKRARVIILNRINLAVQRRIGASRLTAAETLRTLETIYHRTSDIALGMLKQKIQSLRFDERGNQTIEEYLEIFEQLVEEYRAKGGTLEEKEEVQILATSFSIRFGAARTKMAVIPENQRTVENLKMYLIEENEYLVRDMQNRNFRGQNRFQNNGNHSNEQFNGRNGQNGHNRFQNNGQNGSPKFNGHSNNGNSNGTNGGNGSNNGSNGSNSGPNGQNSAMFTARQSNGSYQRNPSNGQRNQFDSWNLSNRGAPSHQMNRFHLSNGHQQHFNQSSAADTYGNGNPTRERTCFNCGGIGHTSRECPSPRSFGNNRSMGSAMMASTSVPVQPPVYSVPQPQTLSLVNKKTLNPLLTREMLFKRPDPTYGGTAPRMAVFMATLELSDSEDEEEFDKKEDIFVEESQILLNVLVDTSSENQSAISSENSSVIVPKNLIIYPETCSENVVQSTSDFSRKLVPDIIKIEPRSDIAEERKNFNWFQSQFSCCEFNFAMFQEIHLSFADLKTVSYFRVNFSKQMCLSTCQAGPQDICLSNLQFSVVHQNFSVMQRIPEFQFFNVNQNFAAILENFQFVLIHADLIVESCIQFGELLYQPVAERIVNRTLLSTVSRVNIRIFKTCLIFELIDSYIFIFINTCTCYVTIFVLCFMKSLTCMIDSNLKFYDLLYLHCLIEIFNACSDPVSRHLHRFVVCNTLEKKHLVRWRNADTSIK